MASLTTNKDVAKVFYEIADLLDLLGDRFKPRAYRRAARSIDGLSEHLSDIAARGALEEIPGVGKAISLKIQEYLKTGKVKALETLRGKVSPGLVELLRIPDVGPRTVQQLHDKLGIRTIEQLQEALAEHRIRDLPGFGERSEESIRRNLELFLKLRQRRPLSSAYHLAQKLLQILGEVSGVERIEPAGSLRRWRETVGDLDILIASEKPGPIMKAFTEISDVKQVLAHGTTKSSIILSDGMQVDLRVVKPESFGAALQYFTGSKAHNIALRRIAQKRKWKLSEYSLSDAKDGSIIAQRTEAEIYEALGMPWIPPELREDSGEIEAAQKNQLPKLVELDDIRGDLHVHTKWSDGRDTIEAMVTAAIQRGYEYIVISDHSKTVRIAKGLAEEKLLEQIHVIRRLDATLADIHVLSGVEVEILSDGTLDLADDALAETDVVTASIHYDTRGSEEKMTGRLLRAMENEYVDILAHPTGRLVGERPSYSVNLDKLFEAAKQNRVFLEINSHRLDISDVAARRAKALGLKLAVNSDAHWASGLEVMRFGVAVARRGWLEARDVVNTFSFTKLRQVLKHVHIN
ncbi:MAG: DNA polymerase/3'-5' exonuclease PolX [Promethearchaeota archaeon]